MEKFKIIGTMVIIAFASLLALGCSESNPVNPSIEQDVVYFAPIGSFGNQGELSKHNFKHYGEIVVLDAENRQIYFAEPSPYSRDEQGDKLVVYVAENAVMITDEERLEKPFDFTKFDTGTKATVYGNIDREGTIVVDRVVLFFEDPDLIETSSLN